MRGWRQPGGRAAHRAKPWLAAAALVLGTAACTFGGPGTGATPATPPFPDRNAALGEAESGQDQPGTGQPAGQASLPARTLSVERLPGAASVRHRAVVTAARSVLRTGRGSYFAAVATAFAGDELTYLGSEGGWLQLQTPDGAVGWLPGPDARLEAEPAAAVSHAIRPGTWVLTQPEGGLTLTVTRGGSGGPFGSLSGNLQVTVAGTAASLLAVADHPAGRGVILAAREPLPSVHPARLDVGEAGLRSVHVSPDGIWLEFADRPPAYRLRTADNGFAAGGGPASGVPPTPGGAPAPEPRLALEFYPVALAPAVLADERGYLVRWRGETAPRVVAAGDAVTLLLPGVAWEGLAPGERLPVGVAVTGRPGGAEVRLPVAGNYALFPVAEGIEVRSVAPGLAGKRIVLDPGHGGEETGAVGRAGVVERDLNLRVAREAARRLTELGADVYLTRHDPARSAAPVALAGLTTLAERTRLDLQARADLANELAADLFISIHFNSGSDLDRGTEVWWAQRNLNNERSRHLAEIMQRSLIAHVGLVDRGVKQRNFHVVREARAPAVLVEVGFLSRPEEEAYLASDTGVDRAARGIVEGVRSYFAAGPAE